MNQTSPLSLEDSVKQVMPSLPPVVRSYLAQGKYSLTAKSLSSKYGLRVDQGGVLERELMLMLMGIESPAEFTEALTKEAGIVEQTVASLLQEINTQVFVPLREQMEKGSAPAAPAKQSPTGVGVPRYAPTAPTIPAAVAPTFTPPPRPAQPAATQRFTPFPQGGVVAPPLQSPRYPGQEGNVNPFLRRVPQQPPAPTQTPSISVIKPPAPQQPAPPTNLPGTFLPPAPRAPIAPPPPAAPGTDPYREPF